MSGPRSARISALAVGAAAMSFVLGMTIAVLTGPAALEAGKDVRGRGGTVRRITAWRNGALPWHAALPGMPYQERRARLTFPTYGACYNNPRSDSDVDGLNGLRQRAAGRVPREPGGGTCGMAGAVRERRQRAGREPPEPARLLEALSKTAAATVQTCRFARASVDEAAARRRSRRPRDPHPRTWTNLLGGVAAAMALVKAYRMHGHLAARLDPLGSEPMGDPRSTERPIRR